MKMLIGGKGGGWREGVVMSVTCPFIDILLIERSWQDIIVQGYS
jgi:hypothetical protein